MHDTYTQTYIMRSVFANAYNAVLIWTIVSVFCIVYCIRPFPHIYAYVYMHILTLI